MDPSGPALRPRFVHAKAGSGREEWGRLTGGYWVEGTVRNVESCGV